ncbi:MAG TPA: hypothetical protein VF399_03780 [bacterium]
MRYALAIAFIASLSFGLIDESFRYQSTAGLWEDDYDLLFDPARICEINGSRLWTSLSNFVIGSENQFSNGSMPYVLLGGSTNFSRYYPGMVYDRSNTKDALDTGLDDIYGNSIYGDGEVSEIDWNDIDNNGVYDQRIIETTHRSAYNLGKDNDFYLGVGTKMNTLRLGLGFRHENWESRYTTPANNFAYDYTEEDLNTSSLTFESHAAFAGDNVATGGLNGIIFSGWMDKEKMSLGLLASYEMNSYNQDDLIIGDSATYTDPADHTQFFRTVNVLDSLDIPESGMGINLELRDFYNYSENAQGRFFLGFFMEKGSISDDAVGSYHMTSENSFADFTWDTLTTTSFHSGSSSYMGFRLGTKQLFKITDRLRFGIGFFFASANGTDSSAVKDTTVDVEVYNDNDGNTVDPDDYVSTTWSSETWMTRTTGSSTTLTFPVGLEFNITQPFVFRLGAVHEVYKGDYSAVQNLIQYEPERTRIVDGTGAVTETIVDPGQEPVGTDEDYTVNEPSTDYYYGAGWQVTDNLQIDFMGFYDLTDMTNWSISATLEF